MNIRSKTRYLSLAMLLTALCLAVTAWAEPPTPESGDFERWFGYDQETVVTESGLQYKVIKMGGGERPESRKSKVTVLYRGFLADGRQFDTTYEWGVPLEAQLRKTIEGWEEGIQLMPVGSKFVFLIPPELGYGKRGKGRIPPNAWMLFEVELMEVKN